MSEIVNRNLSPDQEQEFLSRLGAAGLDDNMVQVVIESSGNVKAMEIVAMLIRPELAFPSYLVTVNYDLSVEELVEDGEYDVIDDGFCSDNFWNLEKGKAKVDIYLVTFDVPIKSKKAIKEMKAQGFRPATLKELLSLGVDHPKLQLGRSIIALGSTTKEPGPYSELNVPCLSKEDKERSIDLVSWRGPWRPGVRFAAVRK